MIFYHIFPLLFIDILSLSHIPQNYLTCSKTEKEKTLPFLLGNQGGGLDGGFDLCFGVKNAQAKSDRSLWEGPNGVVRCRRTVKSWATEDAEFLF